MIFGKRLSAEQMAQLPLFIREYKPVEVTERSEVYRIPNTEGLPYKIVFSREGGKAG